MSTSSVFKSASRRTTSSSSTTATTSSKALQQQSGHQSTLNSTQKGPPRRSRSVSAFSRTQLDLNSEFSNKRDNPLFWVEDESPCSDGETRVKFSKFDDIPSKSIDPPNLTGPGGGVGDGENRRGRTVSRNSGGERKFSVAAGGGRKDLGRSLSRVDTGRRRRSPSRGHYGNCEREKEQESGLLSHFRSKSIISSNANHSLPVEKNNLVRSTSDLSEILKGWNKWSSQHPAFETSDDSSMSLSCSRIPQCDNGRSTSSTSEVEEKTINLVSEEKKINHLKDDISTTGGIAETVRNEVRRAISDIQNDLKSAVLWSNSEVVTSSILSDIAPELANPDVVELVKDIRVEYARELKQCEERTRKLRAELAVEEHRGLELNQILNDITPEPEAPQVQKPRAIRKASMERRKVSRRLEEEAMAYFDECVSISTFDDSDFSSLEDPPLSMVRVNDPGSQHVIVPGVPSIANIACLFESKDLKSQNPLVQHDEGSDLPANRSCTDSSCRSSLKTNPHSFTPNPSGTPSLEQDIRNYVKIFSKDKEREICNSQIVHTGHRNTEDYTSRLPAEKFLLDRMTYRSRVESGSMLLCFGASGFSTVLW